MSERFGLAFLRNDLDRPAGCRRWPNLVSQACPNHEGNLLLPTQLEFDEFDKQDFPAATEYDLRPGNEKRRMANPKEEKG
jgi:hypothetical protein